MILYSVRNIALRRKQAKNALEIAQQELESLLDENPLVRMAYDHVQETEEHIKTLDDKLKSALDQARAEATVAFDSGELNRDYLKREGITISRRKRVAHFDADAALEAAVDRYIDNPEELAKLLKPHKPAFTKRAHEFSADVIAVEEYTSPSILKSAYEHHDP